MTGRQYVAALLAAALFSWTVHAEQITVTPTGSGGGGSGTVTNVATSCGVSGGPITTTGTITGGDFDNPISATTDTIANSQCGQTNRYTGASATTTVPVSTGFAANFTVDYKCEASGGCTLTPSATTINGSSSNISVPNGNSLTLYLDTQATPVWHTKPGNGGTTVTIASGTAALGTGAITSATCATVVTATATGTLTTDVVTASFNGDPTAVTGYIPATAGMLTIIIYPTANTFNAKVCNNTSSSITPGAITLNWRVVR